MICQQCGRICDYLGHDCYACPQHGFDFLKKKDKEVNQEKTELENYEDSEIALYIIESLFGENWVKMRRKK